MASTPHSSRRVRCLSELLGTYTLVLVGPGTVGVVSLLGINALGSLLVVGFAFGVTVAVLILILGKVSGAHVNPVITLAHAFYGKTSLDMIAPYISFQLLGGLLAGFTLKIVLGPLGSPADLGTTKLANGVSPQAGILLETIGTFLLASSGFVASLRIRNMRGEATLIGVSLFIIILILAPSTNASLNPARSLGPAVASGYLTNLYVYMIGPLAGGLIAGLAFRLLKAPTR